MKHWVTLLTIGGLTASIAACDRDMNDMDYEDTGVVTTTMPGETIDEEVGVDTGATADGTDTDTVGTGTGAPAADGGPDTTATDVTATSTVEP